MSDMVLLIGFAPFAGECINPSAEIVTRLDGTMIAGCRVLGTVLPVSFAGTCAEISDLIERHAPRLVLAVGQAGGRAELSLERVAINLVDARIADETGAQPIDEPVIHGAPAAYFSTLPLKAMRARLLELGIPAGLSLSAGTYVCNQAFFALAHHLATRHPGLRGGFVHVPRLPEQAVAHPGDPSMALETMLEGVHAAIECALTTDADLRVAGGTTH
jgi:pyroglutamyl-peptidase